MPRRLLLDGDDLPSLMLRVREEMGPQARIVKAERIRDGGFAGFFARERYELVVEVPDSEPQRRGTVEADGAGGLGALVDAADDGDRADLPGVGPQVSTSGDTFAQVLESMRDIVGEAPEQGRSRPGAVADETVPAPEDAGSDDGARPAFDDATRPAPDDGAVADGAVADGTTPDAAVRGDGLADPAHPVPVAWPAIERPAPDDGATVARLLELGVPVRLLEGFPSLTQPVPLSILVRRFDRPPVVRLEPGVMVVVVGPGDDALRTASQMAQRARLDPREVLLAGEIDPVAGHGRRLLTVAAASRCRSRLREDVPTIVALGVGNTPSGQVTAATLLGALDPDQVWGVLDAGLRAGQMRRWLRAVGELRAVDAIAAVNGDDAQAPGTVLDVGTPVGWVDGLPATPVVWAALLSERLADDALQD